MSIGFLDKGDSPEFQLPQEYNLLGKGVAVPKSYSGHNKGSNYTFYTIEQVNNRRSKELGYEVTDTVEIVEFKNDAKCSAAHRIDASLFEMHPEILGDYERWKKGKESDVTEVRTWDAISVGEAGRLISCGFTTVEQIVATPDQELMVIGLIWKDIKLKAEQHMKKKLMKEQAKLEKDQMSLMQQELAKRDAELAELRALILGKNEVKPVEIILPDSAIVSTEQENIVVKVESSTKPTPKKAAAKVKRKVGVQD